MRTIKFRVWDTTLERFIDYNYPKIGAMLYDDTIVMSTGWNSEKQPTWDWKKVDLYRYEFTQFTGLLDKNGQEIYEGDIVLAELTGYIKYNMKCIIDYENGCFGIRALEDDILVDSKDKFKSFDGCITTERIEIIGNIHENKELITKNK